MEKSAERGKFCLVLGVMRQLFGAAALAIVGGFWLGRREADSAVVVAVPLPANRWWIRTRATANGASAPSVDRKTGARERPRRSVNSAATV
jgi:hypothetical protein